MGAIASTHAPSQGNETVLESGACALVCVMEHVGVCTSPPTLAVGVLRLRHTPVWLRSVVVVCMVDVLCVEQVDGGPVGGG